jgi:hypothetical protein
MVKITGEKFNKKYFGIEFYKLFNESFDETILFDNYEYNNGLNIFNNNNAMYMNIGFKFVKKNKISYIINCNKKDMYICKIIIPYDATVNIHKHMFISDKIILNFDNIQLIENMCEFNSFKFCKIAVSNNGLMLKYIKEKSNKLCKIAVSKNGLALEFVEEQTNEICKIAVSKNGLALEFVEEQTNEICKIAIRNNYKALEFVKVQTEEICIFAITLNSHALQYVLHQTEELYNLAISKNYT